MVGRIGLLSFLVLATLLLASFSFQLHVTPKHYKLLSRCSTNDISYPKLRNSWITNQGTPMNRLFMSVEAEESTATSNSPTDTNTPATKDRLGMYAPGAGESEEFGIKNLLIPLLIAAGGVALYYSAQAIDFDEFLQQSVTKIESLGPLGYLYFGLVYVVAEVLAIPAIPLTTSSGYLFGLLPGTLIVLVSATIAASLSFFIGRTYLRSWAQSFIEGSPKWRAVDKAVGKQGFKVVLLLRLSPLLPFALSNYLYAVTSVDFWSFISGTFLGFAPGSFGYVYFGSIGKEVFSSSSTVPWYAYAAIGALVIFGAQTIGKIATDAVKEMEIDGEAESYEGEGI